MPSPVCSRLSVLPQVVTSACLIRRLWTATGYRCGSVTRRAFGIILKAKSFGSARHAPYLFKQLDGTGKVAILEGIPGEQNGINRETAFRQQVKGKLEIVQATPADYERSKALNKTEGMLRAHPDLNGIFAANDLMGLGAARAVLNAGKQDQIKV